MGNIIKALCLTLLFFAYSFGLLGTGMFLEKRILDIKEAENVQQEQEANIENSMTTEEYHKYYDIVVSRIITSEFEGLNKDAIKEYVKGYDERFNKIADLFYPDRDKAPDSYGTNFPIMFSGLKKAFDENELNMYKGILLNTSSAISKGDIEIIFKNPAEDAAQAAQGQDSSNSTASNAPVDNSVEAAAKRALEGASDITGVASEENTEVEPAPVQ